MITGIETDYQSDAGSTKDNRYLALTDELWGAFCEYLWENWQRYNGTALYMYVLPFSFLYVGVMDGIITRPRVSTCDDKDYAEKTNRNKHAQRSPMWKYKC